MYWRTARFAQLGVKKCRDKPNVQSVSRRYSLIISSIRNAEKRLPLGRKRNGGCWELGLEEPTFR